MIVLENDMSIKYEINGLPVKYDIGDYVRITSTGVIGMVISIKIEIYDTGISMAYCVTYPNGSNEPDDKMFFECELEETESTPFGFSQK